MKCIPMTHDTHVVTSHALTSLTRFERVCVRSPTATVAIRVKMDATDAGIVRNQLVGDASHDLLKQSCENKKVGM